jgi:hypothetical protein
VVGFFRTQGGENQRFSHRLAILPPGVGDRKLKTLFVLSACFSDLGRLSEPNVGLMTDTVSTPTGADGLLTLQKGLWP